jgi:hypothetical protein
MEFKIELGTKSKAFQTPARGPFKNEEETIDLDWTPDSPQLSGGTALSDLDVTVMEAAVEAVEKVIIRNEERLKLFVNKLTDSNFATDSLVEMLDVKIAGVTNAISLRPTGDIGQVAPTIWGNLSHLADVIGEHHSKLSQGLLDKMNFLASKSEFSNCYSVARSALSQMALVQTSMTQGHLKSTTVFSTLTDRLDKAEDLIVDLQRDLQSCSNMPLGSNVLPPSALGNMSTEDMKILAERVAKLKVLSDTTCMQLSQLGLSSLSEVSGWVRQHYGTHRFCLMCDVYVLFDRILGDSESDQLAMMNKMQYQMKCNLAMGSKAMDLFSLYHIVPCMFHHTTPGSFGVGRHVSALSQLKSWEEWSDGTHGMKQYILRRLPVVE